MNWDISEPFCHNLPSEPIPEIGKILVTGASGYIGGRLVPELLARGYEVRVMVRSYSPEYVERWPGAEIVAADALYFNSLVNIMKDIHTAYYLIHSLLLGEKKFETADIEAAINFRKAAAENNVKRIIYLGGLGDLQVSLSPHLRSRIKVADELSLGEVPTTILRAAIIIGSGSASFEIMKHLLKNSPVILIPLWAKTMCQPIAIRDVIKYLVGVLEKPETVDKNFDIGGGDILTYEMMLRHLSDILGSKNLFLSSPVKNVRILAYVVSLFTPVPVRITRCLMEGIRNEVICHNYNIVHFLPFKTIPYKESLVRALTREEQDQVHTRWSDAYPPAFELAIKLHELETLPRYTSSYTILSDKSATALYGSVCKIGGDKGWFNYSWMWRVRGAMDRLFMGVGTSRGRKKTDTLRINDVIDFWRIEDLKANQRMLLRAEMKVPGKAWLEFTIAHTEEKNRLTVTAWYEPRGIFGICYWYFFLPFHHYIFDDLIKQIEIRSSD
ncbi:MAG: SDR family oxidoreductase [Desulfobacterales bacterium]|nr:SDR family oxidoreductase [Desulfobacterales bacterium]